MRTVRLAAATSVALAAVCCTCRGAEPVSVDRLAESLRKLKSEVLSDQQREQFAHMVREDLRNRIRAANAGSSRGWGKIKTREDWERLRQARLGLLRDSLAHSAKRPKRLDGRTTGTFTGEEYRMLLRRQRGEPVGPPPRLNTRLTGTLTGDGYRIENLVFESRPGLWVTANLYVPSKPADSMPGILICHSHHTPKEHGELQDMGMTWARAGCLVLVMDQLGHGQRRQHPFVTAEDFHKPYRVGRQDYYFRYDTGIQLHLVGESLVGWMAWDLMRGVDLLLARKGVDPERIILLGAVAGGGDPAAVAAALDTRIKAAVPFNFGGPQPETTYPLPEDAGAAFNYAGSGSWESTRNLRRSAAGGFLPWVIVGSLAPRRLIYAHEFSWDRENDPVWQRLEKIYGFYSAREHLAFTHGRGELKLRPPAATHCTHVGREHRKMIHPALKKWFGISVTEADEFQDRCEPGELKCMTPGMERELRPKQLCDLLPRLGAERVEEARGELAILDPEARRAALRLDWSQLLGVGRDLGPIDLRHRPTVRPHGNGLFVATQAAISCEPGIVVPTIFLWPVLEIGERRHAVVHGRKGMPTVVAVAQEGKEAFLRHRAGEIATLLAGGAAVCLPDVRGTGETRESTSRGRYGADVGLSSTELMLGSTMVGARLRDLSAVLRYLREVLRVDGNRIALWGDSFAEVNPAGTDFRVPRHMDGRAKESEPLGGLLALLGALYDGDVCAVYVRGGLGDFQSVLKSQFVEIPHDVVIPDVLTAGDLSDVAAALAPRPLRLEAMVDGLNRRLSDEAVCQIYRPALDAYRDAGAADRLSLGKTAGSPARWILEQIR